MFGPAPMMAQGLPQLTQAALDMVPVLPLALQTALVAVYVTLVHVGLWLLVGCLGLYVRYRLLKVLSAGYTFLFRELFNLSQMPVLITTVANAVLLALVAADATFSSVKPAAVDLGVQITAGLEAGFAIILFVLYFMRRQRPGKFSRPRHWSGVPSWVDTAAPFLDQDDSAVGVSISGHPGDVHALRETVQFLQRREAGLASQVQHLTAELEHLRRRDTERRIASTPSHRGTDATSRISVPGDGGAGDASPRTPNGGISSAEELRRLTRRVTDLEQENEHLRRELGRTEGEKEAAMEKVARAEREIARLAEELEVERSANSQAHDLIARMRDASVTELSDDTTALLGLSGRRGADRGGAGGGGGGLIMGSETEEEERLRSLGGGVALSRQRLFTTRLSRADDTSAASPPDGTGSRPSFPGDRRVSEWGAEMVDPGTTSGGEGRESEGPRRVPRGR